MTAFNIREYEPADIPALTALWARTFGDGEGLIGAFFRLLPDMGSGAVAVKDGQVIGAAYVITGLELAGAGAKPPVCGYIYAVAVDEAHRHLGAGRALTLAAAQLGRGRGAEIICTLPAELSLYGWYRDILGVDCALRRKTHIVRSAAVDPCMKLSASEYGLWRENMLMGRAHLRLSCSSLEFARLLCEEYGGGLFACGSGIAAAFKDESRGIIRELICRDDGERDHVAASIGAALGTEDVLVFEPASGGEGEPYIAALPGTIPPDCIWNLSFD